jgi:hypothetical protein
MAKYLEDIRLLGGTVSIGSLTSSNINNLFEVNGNSAIYGTFSTTGLKITNGALSGYILQSDASGNATWVAPSGAGVTGSGTTNYVPRWSGVSTLTSTSSIYDDGSKVGILTTSPGATLDVRGSAIFNENGGDFDFRIEGDTDQNLFFVDASLDNIGIGTSAPTGRKVQINQGNNDVGLYLSGNSTSIGNISLLVQNASSTSDNTTIYAWNSTTTGLGVSIDALANSSSGVTNIAGRFTAQSGTNNYAIITETGDSVFNESGGNYDFRIEGDTDTNLFVVNASRDNIGIGVSTGFMDVNPGVKLLISNTSATSSTNQGLIILTGGSSFSYGVNVGIGSALNTGIGDIGIGSSVTSTSTSDNTYAYYARNLSSSLNNKYGMYSIVSGNGLSTTNYGVSVDVSGANLTNYGNYANVTGTYSSLKYGFFSRVRNTNGINTQNIGLVSNVEDGFYNVGISIGLGNTLTPSGDYGILNYVSPSYVSNQTTMYGEWIQNGASASTKYGLYVSLSGPSNTNYGSFIVLSGSSATQYGSLISLSGASTQYGSSIQLSGTGSNYGSLITLSGAGVINVGMDISVSGASTNNAIRVSSGNCIFNDNGDDYDFRIEGLTESNLFFVDASNDNIGIGTGTPNSKALIDMTSTTKGFLPPRMTGAQAEAISSPPDGLLVYITNGNGSTILSQGWWGVYASNWVQIQYA